MPSSLTTIMLLCPRRPVSNKIQCPFGDHCGWRSDACLGSPGPAAALVKRRGAPPLAETTQMPPWLAYAIERPSGDQLRPDFPPALLVSGVSHPPSDGISTICPPRVMANVFPSGESAVSPIPSNETMSSSVRRCVCAETMPQAAIRRVRARMAAILSSQPLHRRFDLGCQGRETFACQMQRRAEVHFDRSGPRPFPASMQNFVEPDDSHR